MKSGNMSLLSFNWAFSLMYSFNLSPLTETGLCHHPGDRASSDREWRGPAVHRKCYLHHNTSIIASLQVSPPGNLLQFVYRYLSISCMFNLMFNFLGLLHFCLTAASLAGCLRSEVVWDLQRARQKEWKRQIDRMQAGWMNASTSKVWRA